MSWKLSSRFLGLSPCQGCEATSTLTLGLRSSSSQVSMKAFQPTSCSTESSASLSHLRPRAPVAAVPTSHYAFNPVSVRRFSFELNHPQHISTIESIKWRHKFVDKTRFLGFLMQNLSQVNQFKFIRPAGFGLKTLTDFVHDLCQEDARQRFAGSDLSTFEYDTIDINGAVHTKIKFFDAWEKLNNRLPVQCIRLNFGYDPWEFRPIHFEDQLNDYIIKGIDEIYNARNRGLAAFFDALIKASYEKTGQKVVVLLTNYEKRLTNPDTHHRIETLKWMLEFLAVLKGNPRIQFALLTGNIDSDIFRNPVCDHFTDITRDPVFAEMCGFTEAEIRKDIFPKETLGALLQGRTEEEFFTELKETCGGISFRTDKNAGLYDPRSVFYYKTQQSTFNPYWYSPPCLYTSECIKLMTDHPGLVTSGATVTSELLPPSHDYPSKSEYSLELKPPEKDLPSLLWSTGLLTIDKQENGTFVLKSGNREAKAFWAQNILEHCYKIKPSNYHPVELRKALQTTSLEKFSNVLNDVLTSSKGYSIKSETEFRDFLHLMFLYSTLNVSLSEGEITLQLSGVKYIIRSMHGGSVFDLLKQIKKAGNSHEDWLKDKKDVIELGITYDSKVRTNRKIKMKANKLGIQDSKVTRNLMKLDKDELDS